MGVYVRHERSSEHFYSKADRIYRLWVKGIDQNEEFINTAMSHPPGPALATTYPKVEDMPRVVTINVNVQKAGEVFKDRIQLVGLGFWQPFDFTPVRQSGRQPLSELKNVILTEAMATKYFRDENPIGKNILIQVSSIAEAFTVIGVARNIPLNSSICFDFIIPFNHTKRSRSEKKLPHYWQQVEAETYVLLHPGAQAAVLQAKFPNRIKATFGEKYTFHTYDI
jgi:putative ABC transport system permease protein